MRETLGAERARQFRPGRPSSQIRKLMPGYSVDPRSPVIDSSDGRRINGVGTHFAELLSSN